MVCCRTKDMVSSSLSTLTTLEDSAPKRCGELLDHKLEESEQVDAELEHDGALALLLRQIRRGGGAGP